MPQRFFLKTGKRHELISATFFMIITGANSAGSIQRVPDRLERTHVLPGARVQGLGDCRIRHSFNKPEAAAISRLPEALKE
jgi:hypothetical protein